VSDLTHFIPALAFGGGLAFGLTFDTTGPMVGRRDAVVTGETARPVPVEDRAAADEPMTAERAAAARDGGAARTRDTGYATTAPAPEAPPRARPPE